MPDDVIMPALGMAQITGLIVSWNKNPGDAVKVGDVLFEVETDKATMEVEATAEGFLSQVSAKAGEEIPVGDVIALITDSPEAPDSESVASSAVTTASTPTPEPTTAKTESKSPKKTVASRPAVSRSGNKSQDHGRILVSPKARRIAFNEGLELTLLVKAGYPQPYHAADIETLRKLHKKSAKSATEVSRYFVAEIETDGFTAFADWAAETANITDTGALMAGMVAGCLKQRRATIAIERLGEKILYAATGDLQTVTRTDDAAEVELIVRDLRETALTTVKCGDEEMPAITLTRNKAGLTITFECGARQMSANDAIQLLASFAGRIEEPLRHLL